MQRFLFHVRVKDNLLLQEIRQVMLFFAKREHVFSGQIKKDIGPVVVQGGHERGG